VKIRITLPVTGAIAWFPDDHQALIRDGGSLLVRDARGLGIAMYSPIGWLRAEYIDTEQ